MDPKVVAELEGRTRSIFPSLGYKVCESRSVRASRVLRLRWSMGCGVASIVLADFVV